MAGLDSAISQMAKLPRCVSGITGSRPVMERGRRTTIFSMAGLDPAIQTSFDRKMPQGFVYILASKKNGTLYIGVTNNLAERIWAHKEGRGSDFTKRYNVKMLVWYETYEMVTDAIQRETSLKRWPRQWKLDLIEKENPEWNDLYETLI